jgi:hypothetical protein
MAAKTKTTKRITRTTKVHETREAWLLAATDALAPLFLEKAGVRLPKIKVSVGWPGGRGRKNSVIGQCWPTSLAGDKVAQVFISPALDDVAVILSTLVHELVHAADDCQSGHKGEFVRIAKALGLEGKWTATVAGDDLAAHLNDLHSKVLGAFPHAALSSGDGADGPKKQGTRMLKVVCVEGDEGEETYTVRMTRKWLDAYGAPKCPCHDAPMMEVVS